MDPINRLNRLMETLRQQMATSTKRTETPTAENKPRAPLRSERPSVEQLRVRIEERIRALPPNDPERRRQARRVFLEAVVAWEFGDQLLLDAEFTGLIDRLQETFAADPEIEQELDSVLGGLTESSR